MKKTFNNILKCIRTVSCIVRGKSPDTGDFFEALYSFKKDPWNYANSEYERRKYEETLLMIPGQKFETALEVGCSEGEFTKLLAKRVQKLTAIDVSPTAIKRAGKKLKDTTNVEFILMDIEKQTPKGPFDLILVSEVLYYLDTVGRITNARDSLIDLLKPGGYILLTHMRRETDDVCGFEDNAVGYPTLGAATIHTLFDESGQLKKVNGICHELYKIDLYQKQAGKQ